MQRTRFMVLTGHLNDYPLSDLVGILRHQRKTGRLLIEYPVNPAIFYFKDGDLVDAQLHTLSGLQAICVALSQPNASFNFNPLIQPPRRSIDNALQKVVLELLGCWEEGTLDIKINAEGEEPSLAPPPQAQALPHVNREPLAEAKNVLALPPALTTQATVRRKRQILIASAVSLLMLSLSTVIALTGGFSKKEAPAPQISTPSVAEKPTSTGEGSSATVNPSENSSDTTASRSHREEQGKERRPGRELLKEETGRTYAAGKDETAAPPQAVMTSSSANIVKNAETAKDQDDGSETETVRVLMQFDENGRVSQASIADHRPGMEAYEALALRIARGRRSPGKAGGQETVLIKVNPPK